MRIKALQFYIKKIKPVSDKIPYFRDFAKIIWNFYWNAILALKSLYFSIDFKRIYWIDPQTIKLGLSHMPLITNKAYINQDKNKLFKLGSRKHYIFKFEDKPIYKSFYEHFVAKKPWNETELYNKLVNNFTISKNVWRCSSLEDYNHRFKNMDKLYDDIKRNGIKPQKELHKSSVLRENKIKETENEIIIYIGSEGELIHYNGQHRLCIAKLLELKAVPVQILYRHKDWLRFRKEIIKYIHREMRGKAYQPILHPDLSDIPSLWSEKRFKIIRNNLSVRKGTLLDIGAYWGYFCHQFEKLGFQCTALESFEKNLYFMKKLKQAEILNFDIIEKSIFDEDLLGFFEESISFDIVLALNLFNQKLDIGKTDFTEKFVTILRKIRAKELYLQIPEEEAIQGLDDKDKRETGNFSYRNLIECIMGNTQFSQLKKIGEERNHGVYKLF